MALEGMELIVVLIIVVVVLLWGPKKLPELAKGIGEARREFTKASQEPTTATAPVAAAPVVAAPVVAAPAAVAPVAPSREEDMLILTARKLGIYTEGKTRDEISAEIVNKAASAKVRRQPAKTEETSEE